MFSKGNVENKLLGGSRMKSQKGERNLLMVWKPISIRDSCHMSQGGECWYFGYLISIGEGYMTWWRRFQKIQQAETCTDIYGLRLSTVAD